MSITFSRKKAALLVALAVFLLFDPAAWTPPAAAEETAVGTPSVTKQGDDPFAAGQPSVESSRRDDPFGHAAKPAVSADAVLSALAESLSSLGAAPRPAVSAKAGGSSSHPAPRPDRPPLASGEEAILAALGEKSEAEFFDAPLQDVVNWFQDQHRVRIHIDTRALGVVGLGIDTPIRCDIKDVSFRSTLELMLLDLELTWTIRNEVLMITTPEEAELHLIIRVYEVADLVEVRDQQGRPWEDYDSLIHTITNSIEPESWDYVGGPGSVSGAGFGRASVLVIRQTYPIHEIVAQLLEDLRAAGENKPGDATVPIRNKPDPQPVVMQGGGFGCASGPFNPEAAANSSSSP